MYKSLRDHYVFLVKSELSLDHVSPHRSDNRVIRHDHRNLIRRSDKNTFIDS